MFSTERDLWQQAIEYRLRAEEARQRGEQMFSPAARDGFAIAALTWDRLALSREIAARVESDRSARLRTLPTWR